MNFKPQHEKLKAALEYAELQYRVYVEKLAAAFLKEVGSEKASEYFLEQVIDRSAGISRTYFRRKDEVPNHSDLTNYEPRG